MASTLTLEVRAHLDSLDGDSDDHYVTAVDVAPVGTTGEGSPVVPFIVEKTRWFGRQVYDDPMWYRNWEVLPTTDAHGVFWPLPIYKAIARGVRVYSRSYSRFKVETPGTTDLGPDGDGGELIVPDYQHTIEVEITVSADPEQKTHIDAGLDVRDTQWRFTTDVGVFDVAPTSNHLDELEAFWLETVG